MPLACSETGWQPRSTNFLSLEAQRSQRKPEGQKESNNRHCMIEKDTLSLRPLCDLRASAVSLLFLGCRQDACAPRFYSDAILARANMPGFILWSLLSMEISTAVVRFILSSIGLIRVTSPLAGSSRASTETIASSPNLIL